MPEPNVAPFGADSDIVPAHAYGKLLLAVVTLTLSPREPSKATSPICPAVLVVTVVAPPTKIEPVKPTLAMVYGGGGTNKKALLTASPNGVLTVT